MFKLPPLPSCIARLVSFLDHIHDRPGETDDVDLTKPETAVDRFTSVMCQRYDSERRDKVLMALGCSHSS